MVDGLLTRATALNIFSGRIPAVAAALLVTVAWRPAAAITLETYFLELNDRERGAYMTGFVELFANDTARDADYRECVAETGAASLHQALTDTVQSDPRMLTYEAVPWILYTAASLCKRPGAKPPPPEPVRKPEPVIPEQPATGVLSGLPKAEAEAPPAPPPPDGRAPYWLAGGVAGGLVAGLLGALLVGRLRRRGS